MANEIYNKLEFSKLYRSADNNFPRQLIATNFISTETLFEQIHSIL